VIAITHTPLGLQYKCAWELDSPWDSYENGNEKHISVGMRMGMEMISMGVGMLKNRP